MPVTACKNKNISERSLIYAAAFLCGFITLLSYLPALGNGFVEWDDLDYIINNRSIRSLSAEFIKNSFTTPVLANWHPLTMLSYAVDYRIWGLDPLGFHLTNIVLHSAVTAAVLVLAVRLMEAGGEYRAAKKIAAGAVASLLFGLHPAHVESVAWAAERKDVLCALFFTLSVLSYLYYCKDSTKKTAWYALTTAFFALALLSKPMAVTLPVVLLILDYYPLGRLNGRDQLIRAVTQKIPLFFLSAVAAALTIWAQRGAMAPLEAHPVSVRILITVRAYAFYIYKLIYPVNLAPFYPILPSDALFDRKLFASVALMVLVSGFCLAKSRSEKKYLAAWLYYLVTLVPVIGIVQVGDQAAADRYMYLPSLGLFMLVGAFAVTLFEKARKAWRRAALSSLMAAAALLLISGAARQISIWHDSMTLWNYEISVYPSQVPFAYNNRGYAYGEAGAQSKAIADYTTSIRLNPRQPYPYNNRGLTYSKLGDYKRALQDYEAALKIDPKYAYAYNNRGLTYQTMGDQAEAIKNFDSAIALKPGYAYAYVSRGVSRHKLGQIKEALADYEAATRIDPGYANAYINRGIAHGGLGDYSGAIKDLDAAASIAPVDASVYLNRGVAYLNTAEYAKAEQDFLMTIKLEPKAAQAYQNLAILYEKLGEPEKRDDCLKKAASLGADAGTINNGRDAR